MTETLSILQGFPRRSVSRPRRDLVRLQSADEAFLLAIGAVRSNERVERLRELRNAHAVSWSDLWQLAARHNLQPLLAYRVRDQLLASVIRPEMLDASGARLQTMARNMVLHAELERIGSVLGSQGIPAAPLKGTALAQRLFRALDARPSTDIDILVPEKRYNEARALLLDAGYQPVPLVKPGVKDHPFHGIPLYTVIGGHPVVVELHWNLSDPRFVSIDHGALWERILARAEPDRNLDQLPAEDLLIFLAIHCAKHPEGVLRLLTDIDQLIVQEGERIDWEQVCRIAETWQVSDLLYFPLFAVSTLFETPVPNGTLWHLRPRWWKRALVKRIAGLEVIVTPPVNAYLQESRFRLAYCLMLRPNRRVAHAYWHYMLLPAADTSRDQPLKLVHTRAVAPLIGIARTVFVLGTSVREGLRRPRPVHR